MIGHARALLTVFLLLVLGVGAEGSDGFVIKAGRVLPLTPGSAEIENGTVIVRGGKIVAVGKDFPIPPDLVVHEFPDGVVMPGLVAAATEIGGFHRGDESVAAAYRALDAYDRYGNYARVLSRGVTTAHVGPGGHRLLSGQGAVVKLSGAPEERVVNPASDLTVNLGEGAVNAPPMDATYSFPASADVEIPQPRPQRPASRLGQFLALEEEVEAALDEEGGFSIHREALADTWRGKKTLRIRANRAADLLGALAFLRAHDRSGYLVGGGEAHRILESLERQGTPLVYRPRHAFRAPGADLGPNPSVLTADYGHIHALGQVPLALGVPVGQDTGDLRLTAVAAHGAGLERQRALEAITRVPAEILGVADRVGSLAPGKDADLLVLHGDPLAVRSHVTRVYIGGREVFRAPEESGAIVVRAGTIWASPDSVITPGEILIENGKVVAVGSSVPHPPFARVIDAGREGFVTPGFIDARGHLGLRGERNATNPDVDLTLLVGAPDVAHERVARAGITTLLMSPYAFASRGSRLAAVKTLGGNRTRVLKPVAALGFNVRSQDPAAVQGAFKRVLDAGKKYVEKWAKYEKELAAYLEKLEKGEKVDEPREVEEEVQEPKEDPITGTWEGTITGGPLPEPQTGKMALRLDGDQIEGRVVEPPVPVEHRIVMTLTGNQLSGIIEVDTGGQGVPQIEGELTGPDAMKGTVSVGPISVDFEARRIDKSAVEFKVVKKRLKKGGRPTPPKVDPALEPVRALLSKKIPAVVDVQTPAQIAEVLDLFLEKEKLPVILLNAEGAEVHAERLAKERVGVVLPRNSVRTRRGREYHQGGALARAGVPVAFQSGAEDGARDLPFHILYMVERGLSPEAALEALTAGAARMYRIDDRVGTLAPGKDADLLLFRGHPFRSAVPVERVFIDGKEVTP